MEIVIYSLLERADGNKLIKYLKFYINFNNDSHPTE